MPKSLNSELEDLRRHTDYHRQMVVLHTSFDTLGWDMFLNGGKFGDGILWDDPPLPSNEAWTHREMVERQAKHTDGPPWLHEPDVDMLAPTDVNGDDSCYDAHLKARDMSF